MPGLLCLGLGYAHACDLRVAEGGPGDQVLVHGMGLSAGGVLNGNHALLGRLVRERLLPDQVADRVDLLVRRALVLVDLDLPVLVGLDPGVPELQRLGVGCAPAGDAEIVHLGFGIAVLHLHRALAGLDALHLGAGRDLDVLLLEGALDHLRDVLVLGGRIWSSISIRITSVPKRP